MFLRVMCAPRVCIYIWAWCSFSHTQIVLLLTSHFFYTLSFFFLHRCLFFSFISNLRKQTHGSTHLFCREIREPREKKIINILITFIKFSTIYDRLKFIYIFLFRYQVPFLLYHVLTIYSKLVLELQKLIRNILFGSNFQPNFIKWLLQKKKTFIEINQNRYVLWPRSLGFWGRQKAQNKTPSANFGQFFIRIKLMKKREI